MYVPNCDEATYLGYRTQAFDAIHDYEFSFAGVEDAVITSASHPFTNYEDRPNARVYQAVLTLKQADTAAAAQDWSTACTRATQALESLNVDVAALPSLHEEVADQAQLEAAAVAKYAAHVADQGFLTFLQYATVAVVVIGAVWIVSKGLK